MGASLVGRWAARLAVSRAARRGGRWGGRAWRWVARRAFERVGAWVGRTVGVSGRGRAARRAGEKAAGWADPKGLKGGGI